MKDFDAVIIGAGLGGLSAATALSKAGKKVLLLEKHNVPGGYATTFMRGRFEFDVSLHELSGVGTEGNRGPAWGILDGCGVASKVEFIPIPDFYRCIFPGLDITLPLGRQNFEDLLCREFPAEADGIKRFSSIVFDLAQEAIEFSLSGKKPNELDPAKFPTMATYAGCSVAEVLYSEVSDKKARTVLSMICNYLGQTPSRGAFAPFTMAVTSYLIYGPVHIRGKSQALSQAFVDTIEECGGQVWLNNGAARIIASGEKVRGVVAEDGTRIECPYVVSNANPFSTCLELMGRENVPDWYLNRLGIWSPGIGTFNVFLGLDRPYADFGISSHETFVGSGYDDWETADEASKSAVDVDPPGISICTYNVADETFSPPGTTAMALTLGGYSGPWLKLTPDEYVAAKDKMAEKAIAFADNLAPGLRDHIEVMEVATPLTNIRYSGNPGGSFFGFAESRQPTGLERIPFRGPVEGLYFASAWVYLGGGYFPTIFGGWLAANEVVEDMNRAGRDPGLMKTLENRMKEEVDHSDTLRDAASFLPKGLDQKIYTHRISLKTEKVIEETPSTKTFRMVPKGGNLPYFRAGQYINLFVEIDGILTSRPYTISSSPGEPWYDLTVRKKENGFVSPFLHERVRPGDTFVSTVPNGHFYYNPIIDSADLVFLAGGCGITPFISMLREVTGKQLPLKIHLIYGSRFPSDIIFKQELEEMASKHPNIKVDFVISESAAVWDGHRGFLDEAMLSSLIETVEEKSYFICGPDEMVAMCEDALNRQGVPGRRIKKEASGPPDDITLVPGWNGVSPDAVFEIIEEKSGRTFQARAVEPLMVALERAGMVIPVSCRSGECGACRTRLVSGRVFVPDNIKVRQSDQKANYVHACMSYPLEDLRIRL
jgi:prolycopene isomerase